MNAMPRHLPKRYHKRWQQPWTMRARRSWGFRRWLRSHGYLSPNFTIAEAGGQGRNEFGTPLPKSMWKRASNQAFRLERARHAFGDRSMSILSWYRNPKHNAAVGGVKDSQHLNGIATDFSNEFINSVGRARFDTVMNRLFSKGGFGHYPSGSGHVDSRGWRARW